MLFKVLKRAYYNMLFDIIRLAKSSSFVYFFHIGSNQSLRNYFVIGTALVSIKLRPDACIFQRKNNFSLCSIDLHGRYLV